MFPGFILHPLYQTINNSEQQEKRGDTDKLKLTGNNEVASVHTHIPSRQPPSSYCVAHKSSHPQDHSSLARVGSSAPREEPQRDGGGAVSGQAGYKVPSATGTLDWDDGQYQQCAAGMKVKVKVGQGVGKKKQGRGFIIHGAESWATLILVCCFKGWMQRCHIRLSKAACCTWKQELWSKLISKLKSTGRIQSTPKV